MKLIYYPHNNANGCCFLILYGNETLKTQTSWSTDVLKQRKGIAEAFKTFSQCIHSTIPHSSLVFHNFKQAQCCDDLDGGNGHLNMWY